MHIAIPEFLNYYNDIMNEYIQKKQSQKEEQEKNI